MFHQSTQPRGGEFDVGQLPVGPFMEDISADALGLEQPDDGLHQAVVIGITDGADRKTDAFDLKMLSQAHPAIWVREHAKTFDWAGRGMNVVAPGVVETPVTIAALESEDGRAALEMEGHSPLNGPAAPAAAPAALLSWLTSTENTHVTGQVIFIDGGAESICRPQFV